MTDRELLESIHKKIINIENDQGSKLSALFDAREVQTDVNERILETLNRIEGKVDKISIKVATHDSKLKNIRLAASLSRILCKPPSWCKIKTQAWRFVYEQKKNYPRTKGTTEKTIRITAGCWNQ